MTVIETEQGMSYVTIQPGSNTNFKNALAQRGAQAASVQPQPPIVIQANHDFPVGAGHTGLGVKTGVANVSQSEPSIRNPLLNLVNFYMPYDRRQLNQWIRYYYKFHPLVGNAIDLHSEFPLSDFRFTGITDDKILDIFEEFKEECELVEWMYSASKEYELLSECFSYFDWDEDVGWWTGWRNLNPDLMDYREVPWSDSMAAIYQYELPEEDINFLTTQDPVLQQYFQDVYPEAFESAQSSGMLLLSPDNMVALINRSHDYEQRGTPNLLRCLKDLMYEDMLREVQYAVAERQITPIEIWKIGNMQAGFVPTPQMLDAFRDLVQATDKDARPRYFTHDGVSVDLLGYNGKIVPITPEFDFVEKRILTALFTNKNITSGEGGAYQAGAVINLKVLEGRYQTKRTQIEKACKKRLFRRIALEHQFYERPKADLDHRIRTRKKLIVPGIEWEFKLDLANDIQRMNFLQSMRTRMELSAQTLHDINNIDHDIEHERIKQEEGTVFDPQYQKQREAAAAAEAEGEAGMAGGIGGGGGPIEVGDGEGLEMEEAPEEVSGEAPEGGVGEEPV